MDVISQFAARYERTREEELSLEDYLAECKRNPLAYATAPERMLKAIGEPQSIDTRNDPRMSRLFANKVIKIYPAFAEFYGMEDDDRAGSSRFFRHAAQGLEEERKQILYLLGPVGGGKSIAGRAVEGVDGARCRSTCSKPATKSARSFESPARPVRRTERMGGMLDDRIRYPEALRLNALHVVRGAVKRLDEFGGDITQVQALCKRRTVDRLQARLASAKTEPGDENNQDISALVGKVDIRKLESFAQDDPDAYSYSGGLCLANQGLLEFVEMFKAPIKVLHPLLTATQEGNFKGTEGFGAIPFDGIVLAHSNERASGRPSATTRTTRRSSTASTSSRCRTACASARK